MGNNFKDNGSWFDQLFVPIEEALNSPLWKRQRSPSAKLITEGFSLGSSEPPTSCSFYHSWSKASYIKSSSTVFAFGDGAYGLFMNPTMTNESSIVAASTLITWKDATLTDRVFVGVSTDNKLYTCGYQWYGSLGNGVKSLDISSIISQIGSATDWNYSSVGKRHTILLKTNGSLYATGDNTYGQLGDGTTTDVSTPIQIGTGDWTRVSAKGNFWNAIKSDGSLWTCGVSSSSPVQVGSSTDWVYNAQGFDVIAGIRGATGSGSLWAWSNGGSPIQIGTAENWTKVYCGAGIAAVNTASEMFVWGENTSGQLGLGTTITTLSPTQISGSWNLFASSETSSLFVNTSGYLFGAGSNWFGQLGSIPKTQLSALTFIMGDVSVLDGGKYHTIFLKSDGSLWAVGLNTHGQCGQSDLDEIYSSPVKIPSTITFSSISAGEKSTFAIGQNRSLWACGDDSYYTLGIAYAGPQTSLTAVGTDRDWIQIFSGFKTSYGIRGDGTSGTLWGWGYDTSGNVGDGVANISKITPVQIGTGTNWVSVGANEYLTHGITAAGTLWTWGGDTYDWFGSLFGASASTPVQIGAATNWSKIIPGEQMNVFLNTGGIRYDGGIQVGGQVWGDLTTVKYNTTLNQNIIGYVP